MIAYAAVAVAALVHLASIDDTCLMLGTDIDDDADILRQ